MGYGIDYSNGRNNVDHKTGIHYGVIPQNDVLQAWADSSEADYGEPTCPKCGDIATPADHDTVPDLDEVKDWEDNGRDYVCLECRYSFRSDEAYGDEPNGFIFKDKEYNAFCDSEGDIFILKSPYYTHAQFCSPCAPGACHLGNPVDENGPKAYCFSPDWFDYWEKEDGEPAGEYCGEKTACPYSVYRVSDGACVYRPTRTEGDD
ncbi:MAG: hypothetical protein WC551_09420 [Patescibacteria group bacterium]